MNLELVTVGNELLLGFTIDTNGAEIGQALGRAGIQIIRRTAVGDDPAAVHDAVDSALRRTGAVITTGGLGPTRDDLTKAAVAELFGAPLEFDQAVWDALLARYARLGRTPPESNRIQAMVPRGATILSNRWGTAPGLWLEGPPGLVILLPGVPHEMRRLLEHEVAPRLAERAGGGAVIQSLLVRTTGIPESSLAERVGAVEAAIAPLTLAYLPGELGVDLRLTAWNLPPAEAAERLTTAAGQLRELAGEFCYAVGETDLAEVVLDAARRRGVRIALAESCTGGLVGGRLTAVPGSSDAFLGGVVSYDNAVKTQLLGVPEELIASCGAVSGEVAGALAAGALERLGADLAVSVTGIAGPSGGSPEKPVGTVWFGVAASGRAGSVSRVLFSGERNEIRARAAQGALFALLRELRKWS